MILCSATYCQDDTVRSQVARMALQKLTDLGYETFLHPPYSSDLLLIDYHFFFRAYGHYSMQKTFSFKGEVEILFTDFMVSKLLEFYRTSINDFVNRWQ